VYKHYFQGTGPDWRETLHKMDEGIYGFFYAEIPKDVSLNLVKSVDHESLKKQFEEILEYREIQAANDRTFAIVFFRATGKDELRRLLQLDLKSFIRMKEIAYSGVLLKNERKSQF